MAYSPPSFGSLVTGLARDLRDPGMGTFTEAELKDLINAAIVEVGRIYPKQDVVSISPTLDGQSVFPTDAASIFRVELLDDGKVFYGLRPNMSADTAEGGWDLHGGDLYIPRTIASALKVGGSRTVRVWGYWPREQLASDSDVLDGDAECEFAVRTVAVYMGYQRLQNDRVLFQQWLTNTVNSDVSPNQLAQTADMYQSQWREVRNRLRTLQRT